MFLLWGFMNFRFFKDVGCPWFQKIDIQKHRKPGTPWRPSRSFRPTQPKPSGKTWDLQSNSGVGEPFSTCALATFWEVAVATAGRIQCCKYLVKVCFIYIYVYLYVYMYITILTAIILHKSPNYIFSIIRKRDILCYIYNMILYHVHYLVPPHSNCEMMNDDHFSKSPQKLYHSPNFIFQSNRWFSGVSTRR